MLITIKNERICAEIDTLGAQLWSLTDASGVQYLWQGDAKYWTGRAPLLFPYIARLVEGKYTFQGQTYAMDKHGFARHCEFSIRSQSDTQVTFALSSSPETLSQYPFDFTLLVTYAVNDFTLTTSYAVENQGDTTMYFGIGGHPAFNAPLSENESFEDYILQFENSCAPKLVGFDDDCFVTGNDTPYPLADGKTIALRHDLFDNDAIILRDMDEMIHLRSKSGQGITVHYPQMTYLGLWHMPKTDAPYVCIEPWTSLPANAGGIADLEKQENLQSLAAHEMYYNTWTITVNP